MPGIIAQGVPTLPLIKGNERIAVDTQISGGAEPQMASMSLERVALAVSYLSSSLSTTAVSGTRYYTAQGIGALPVNANSPAAGYLVTGIAFLIGATGGTDKVIVELHDSTGALIATSALAGATVGTAGTYQQVAFTAPVTIPAGVYFLALQLNGTTARFATYNAPTTMLLTGSATGTFGTSAAITPPTTYTAGVGPIALLY